MASPGPPWNGTVTPVEAPLGAGISANQISRVRPSGFAQFAGTFATPHHGLAALCLTATFLAGCASVGAAAEDPPATGRTATPKNAERMLRHPVTLKTEACPAPFNATTTCAS
jgi:hypothetical protein